MEIFTEDGQECQRWRLGASIFTACLERGARLMRWELELPTGRRQVIYWPEKTDWENFATIRGGNPVLFPFMGRNYAAGEKFCWLDLDGEKRPMPQHGWARQGKFVIEDSGADFVTARFEPDAAARESYPYDYVFRVTYRFRELGLRCEFSLTNNEGRSIPWCAGHHFYFGLPWHPGLGREDYRIVLPAKKFWRHSAEGKLVAVKDGAKETTFADPALADLIHTRLTENRVVFGPKSGEEDVTIRIGEEPIPDTWTAVVTWTPDRESPFYCVEPWMGPPNSPEHKNGLRWAGPGQTETFVVEVALD